MSDSVDRKVVDLLEPATCPKALQKFYTDAERTAIRKGLESGDIEMILKKVKVSAKKSGTGQAEFWPFKFYRAVKVPGMTVLSRGLGRASVPKPENYKDLSADKKRKADIDARDGACDYFNYGWVLTITQPIRIMLEGSLGGVDKAIAKQVTQAMKTGLFASEAEANQWVISQREKLGLEIPAEENDDDDTE